MNLSEKLQEKINQYEDLQDIAKKLEYVPGFENLRITTILDDILIKVSSLQELTNVRKLLRMAFLEKWNDKIEDIWWSSGHAIASYINKDIPEVVIWLETTIEDFPEKLKKNGCRFEKTERLETDYSYVCDTATDND